jgi:hypothetical protein
VSCICKAKQRQRIEVADAAGLALSAFTLYVKFRRWMPMVSTTQRDYALSKGGAESGLGTTNGSNYTIAHEANGSTHQFRYGFYDSTGTDRHQTLSYVIPVNVPIFAAMTYVSGSLKFYYAKEGDAALTLASTTLSGSPTPNTNARKLVFGGADVSTDFNLGGNLIIDEVALWSGYVMTQAELEALRSRRIDPSTDVGPVTAYWPLDDGCGAVSTTTAADAGLSLYASASSYQGTLVNGARWAPPPRNLSYLRFSLRGTAILAEDYIEDVRTTVTSPTNSAGHAPANVQHYLQETYWEPAAAINPVYLTADFGRPVPFRAVVILNHTIPDHCKVFFEASDDNFANTRVSKQLLYHPKVIRGILPYTEQYRYARIRVTIGTGGVSFKIGKLMVGPLMVFKSGSYHDDHSEGRTDNSVIQETTLGSRQVRSRVKRRELSWRVARVAGYEQAQAYKWARSGQVGQYADVMLEPETDLYGKSAYGRLIEPAAIGPRNPGITALALNKMTLVSDEALR